MNAADDAELARLQAEAEAAEAALKLAQAKAALAAARAAADAADAADSPAEPADAAPAPAEPAPEPAPAAADAASGPLGADEIAAARKELGWTAEPFVIPADIASAWAAFGEKGKKLHSEWNDRLASNEKKKEFEDRLSGKVVPGDAF